MTKFPKPVFIAQFKHEGRLWKIYHADRHTLVRGRRVLWLGRTRCLGIAYFKPRRIYIDGTLSSAKIFETTIHEMMHVAFDDMGLLMVIEEPIVNELAWRLAGYLEQLKV